MIKHLSFDSLAWQRIDIRLQNTRVSRSMTAHPVTVFEAMVKGVTARAGEMGKAHSPFFHVKGMDHKSRIRPGDPFELQVFFCKHPLEYVMGWRDAFGQYMADPEFGRNFRLIRIGEPEKRNFPALLSEIGDIPSEGEICLEFLSPIPFQRKKDKDRTFLSRETFIRGLESRFSTLFDRDFSYAGDGDLFHLLPYYWHYTEIRHGSHSQPGHIQYINGCAGRLYIKGIFKELLPYLILGSELHVGAKLSNSQGYYILRPESPAFFQERLTDRKAMTAVLRDVMERYDSPMEALSLQGGFRLDEEAFLKEVSQDIATCSYRPSPNTAFMIGKKKGGERMIEQPALRDLFVQQHVLKVIAPVFERIFESSSIGFRKGVSRKQAVSMVNEAVREGYEYVLESDIEAFFPSVDLGILSNLLDFYLPEKDTILRHLILTTIGNSYLLHGRLHERASGLAQGSPLSPLLANLYLDSFDERIQSWPVRLIRYVDDFIILARTRQVAEDMLQRTETCLSSLRLKLNVEKTAIVRVQDGFRFLGMRFTGTEAEELSGEAFFKQLRKPLYITQPYLFLSVNGEALDIKKDGAVLETIPMRRISEILVMDKSTFSTALIRACVERNIPLTITLGSGYHIASVRPDSKRFHEISFEHARRYYSLTDMERLSIAKEFATGKIRNYNSMFLQKHEPVRSLFINELEGYIRDINGACDVNTVRGIEGVSARKIFQRLNRYINNKAFHIQKRTRKQPDPINSLLNFGYYLLFSRIKATTMGLGLNPYLGFLHSPMDNYESFVVDIQELFRSRMDRFILRILNLGIITKEAFEETPKGFYLNSEGRRKFLHHFEVEMGKRAARNSLSLREAIYMQVKCFKDYFLDNRPLAFYSWDQEGSED